MFNIKIYYIKGPINILKNITGQENLFEVNEYDRVRNKNY